MTCPPAGHRIFNPTYQPAPRQGIGYPILELLELLELLVSDVNILKFPVKK